MQTLTLKLNNFTSFIEINTVYLFFNKLKIHKIWSIPLLSAIRSPIWVQSCAFYCRVCRFCRSSDYHSPAKFHESRVIIYHRLDLNIATPFTLHVIFQLYYNFSCYPLSLASFFLTFLHYIFTIEKDHYNKIIT